MLPSIYLILSVILFAASALLFFAASPSPHFAKTDRGVRVANDWYGVEFTHGVLVRLSSKLTHEDYLTLGDWNRRTSNDWEKRYPEEEFAITFAADTAPGDLVVTPECPPRQKRRPRRTTI